MRATFPLMLALWLAVPAPATAQAGVHMAALAKAPAQADDRIAKEDKRFERVAVLIATQKPDKAVKLLDDIIDDQEKAHRGETRQVYCARTGSETLAYAAMGAKTGKETVVLGPDWCMGIFLKGFALIDLRRPDEAKPLFDRAVAMAPLNAQFLGELAEWHKTRRAWSEAYALYERALAASEFSPDDMKSHDKRRAMRGLGFVLIEQGKLEEAEAMFRKVLAIDPGDKGAKSELQYIEEQRAKQPKRT